MAERYEGDGVAANGFGRRSLNVGEARLLHQARYMVPPDMRAPSGGGWLIGRGGYLVAPIPVGDRRQAEIYDVFWRVLNDAQRADPAWDPDNVAGWDAYFLERRQREMDYHDGMVPPPQYNMEGRHRWWGGRVRTLAAILNHIRAGNEPRLEMPPPEPPRQLRRWAPRQSTSSSSRSSSSAAHTPR